MKALIVDDNPINNLILEDILLQLNIDVVASSSIWHAITTYNSGVFDLVITDLVLPDEDGYDLAMHVYSNSRGKVPILSSSINRVEAEFSNIFYGSIFKPFCRKTIFDTVSPIIIASSRSGPIMPDKQISTTKNYTQELIKSANTDLLKVQSSIQVRDFNQAIKTLHRVKGALLTLNSDPNSISSVEKLNYLLTQQHTNINIPPSQTQILISKILHSLSTQST